MKKFSFTSPMALCGYSILVLIVLKLCGVIEWSWWVVMMPAWALLLLGLIIVIAGTIVYAVHDYRYRKK